ncbi:hypothetical protein MNBD_GAMMA26-341 [hydrothermal vent metagenome]|uniref:DNA-damage-inducible protein J n=1 Tax=hydrothermal vent metagenome TaxID=652676 RepID=A0A3B1BC27_9ZZZZ
MATKVQTSIRLDADKFNEARAILAQLGMNFTEAVNIFTSMVVAKHGLPFDVTLPSATTRTVLQDIRAGKNLETIQLEELQHKTLHSQ